MKREQYLNNEIKRMNIIIEQLPYRMEVVKEGKKDVREGIRQEYDRIKELVDGANVRIAAEEKAGNKEGEVVKNLSSMRDKYEPDLKNMEDQLKELEKEIEEVDITLNVKMEAARSYVALVKKLLKR